MEALRGHTTDGRTRCDGGISRFDYVIVGAGPAGLQMAYFLQKARRSYVVLEGGSNCCGFFEQQPRHRQLISLNKVHNYYTEPEFNMRHDWNSLLSDDPELKFSHYSSDLYPKAEDLIRYMREFAVKTELNVRYSSRVKVVERDDSAQFLVTTEDGGRFCSVILLMATGATRENMPPEIDGVELGDTYATHDTHAEKYNNKRVCIIGGGNSAFETANHISGNAAVVHIFMGHELRFAWNTHYVGDLRAVNNNIIDMYQLKSLHSVLGSRAKRIEKLANGNVLVHLVDLDTHWDIPGRLHFAVEYEYVITCCGFRYTSDELFATDARPKTVRHGRYPALNNIWETDVPNLFYIGTAMAAMDRKSSSGFIHGFRYNVRTLFQLLEERVHGVPLPYLTLDCSLPAVTTKIIERLSISDAMYQMYSVMCDVMVVEDHEVQYFVDLPIKHVLEREDFQSKKHMFIIYMDYGFQKFSGVPVDNVHAPEFLKSKCVPFIHPIFHYYSYGVKKDECELNESLVVRFDAAAASLFPQWPHRTNENYIMQFVNGKVAWTEEQFDQRPFPDEMMQHAFVPLTEEEKARIPKEYDPSKPCRTAKELLPENRREEPKANAAATTTVGASYAVTSKLHEQPYGQMGQLADIKVQATRV